MADDIIALTKTPSITFPKASSTRAELTEQKYAWAKRVLVPAMTAELNAAGVGHAPKDCEAMTAVFFDRTSNAKGRKELLELGEKLVKADSPIPTMQLLVTDEISAFRNETNLLSRRKAGFEEKALEKAPAIVRYLSAIRLLGYGEDAGIPAAKLVEQAVNAAALSISTEHCSAEDAPVILSLILDQTPDRSEKLMAAEMIDAIKKSKSPEWLRLTLIGKYEIALAWKMRGGGFANTVTDAGWRGFEEHLVNARDALAKAWKLMPSRPEAASLMIKVAMGGHAEEGETARLWFDRSVAAQCDYPEAYSSLIYSLTPRWGGSNAEMLAFAIACQKTERYETEIPSYFFHCINSVAEELPDWRIVYRQPEISKMIIETLDKLAKIGKPKPYLDFGDMAYYAWMAGDLKATAKFFNEHGSWTFSQRTASAAVDVGVDTRQAIIEAQPYDSPAEQTVRDARAAIDAKEWAKAEELAAKLNADSTINEMLAIKTLPEVVRFKRDYSLGRWAKLPSSYPEWTRKQSSVNLITPGTITLTSIQDRAAFAIFHGALGDRFEVRGKVKFPRGKRQSFHLLTGHPSRYSVDQPGVQWFQCALETTDGKTSALRYGRSTPFLANPERPGPAIEQEVTFRFRRDKTEVGFWINDKQIVEGLEIPELPSGEGAFGVGGRTYGGKEPVQFSELEARRIGDSA